MRQTRCTDRGWSGWFAIYSTSQRAATSRARGDVEKCLSRQWRIARHRLSILMNSTIEAGHLKPIADEKTPTKTGKTPGHLSPPPLELKKAGRELWVNVVREYEVDDAGSQAVLAEACKAADMAEACRAQIAREGLTIPTRNGVRDHPLIRALLMAQPS